MSRTLLAVALALATPAVAQDGDDGIADVDMPVLDWDRPEGPVDAPLSLTASDGTGLRLVRASAEAVIEGPLAFTELHLTFENPEDRVREGRFEITLPSGAAISRFAMKIDGQWQEGEVVERQRAVRVYEDILHQGQDPALLEHDAGNQFRARVFPIPARATKDLVISWSHELPDASDDYVLPLAGLPALDQLSVDVHVHRADEPVEHLSLTRHGAAPEGDLAVHVGGRRQVALRNGNIAVARVAPAFHVAGGVHEHGQGPGSGNSRIELAQTAGGRVSRVRESLLALLTLCLIEPIEAFVGHVDLASDLQHPRIVVAVQAQGHGLAQTLGGDVPHCCSLSSAISRDSVPPDRRRSSTSAMSAIIAPLQ